MANLDARQKPPENIKAIYKYFQKLPHEIIEHDPKVLDFRRGLDNDVQLKKCREIGKIPGQNMVSACLCFRDREMQAVELFSDVPVFEHEDAPGLFLIPALLPEPAQKCLLGCLMHDSLADPRHKTNVHAHHEISYHAANAEPYLFASSYVADGGSRTTSLPSKKSFFNMSPKSTELFKPLSVEAHNPMTASQFLHKKLRWLTLGLQYDWSKKIYPKSNSPPFPGDLANFTQILFPGMRPEAAIVNIYSPGDTLSVHRDVSEESGQGLVSISLGCDGIFVTGTEDKDGKSPKILAVRLRSGDAIVMSGPSRFAWHGVPQIIANTCPDSLKNWPAEETSRVFDEWNGWMLNKRINLNMRQVTD